MKLVRNLFHTLIHRFVELISFLDIEIPDPESLQGQNEKNTKTEKYKDGIISFHFHANQI
jgi:hypothetical protein